ncbi:MAG: sugar-binding protein, partial [Phycisphaerae bacterium]|nr:sugar-binding protein [Phycisphaerae bacterium]
EDVWAAEDFEIPEDIEKDLEFLAVGSLGTFETVAGQPEGVSKEMTVDEEDRFFAYVIMNHLEEILAIATDNIADALQKMGDILGTDIAKAYPELGGKPEVSGAACASFLIKSLDGLVMKAYDRECPEVVAKPLATRFTEQLAKTLSLSIRQKVLARFKPDLAGYLMRGINNKLISPERLVGDRAREHTALAGCIKQYAKAGSGGKEQADAERGLAVVAQKSLDQNLRRLLEEAMKEALLAQLLAAELDRILGGGGYGDEVNSQLRPMDYVGRPPGIKDAEPFEGSGKTIQLAAKRIVLADIGMRTVKRLIEIRTEMESEKIAKLRRKPAKPVIAGRAKIKQKGAPALGSAFAVTPVPISQERVQLSRHVQPVPPPVISVRFGRATRRTTPIKIEGDLKDWKRAYPLVPRNSRMFRDFRTVMYMQWDPGSIYVCGEMKLDHDKITMRDPSQFWLDDCMEFWLDNKNSKKSMTFSSEHHHFVFCPPDKKPDALGQIKYGGMAKYGVQGGSVWYKKGQLGIQWATRTRKGYFSFEIKLPRGTEFRDFEPYAGNYVGFNYIASSGVEHRLYWAADKMWDVSNRATYVWSNPHMWGDVELVGIEAEVLGVDETYHKEQRYVDLGRPIYIRIKDADMNLDSTKREYVNARVTGSIDAEPMTLYESSPNSGVFVGSIATAHLVDSSEVVPGDGKLFDWEGGEVEVV